MRQYKAVSADDVWRMVSTDLIESPEHESTTRCGDALEFLQCALIILDPRARWVLSRKPAYNPAFGLVEFIWIFNGKNDSDVLRFWNPKLPNFTGSSKYLHGAYGHRLKKSFGLDQIQRAYLALKSNPSSRQVVLQIWDPRCDLPDVLGKPASLDIPCNISSLLEIRGGRLYWTQVMRSNDVMRGLPYNIIQFTMLHEFFASWLGCKMGDYVHISNSIHMYKDCIGEYSVSSDTEALGKGDDGLCLNITFEETSRHLSAIYQDLVSITKLQGEADREKTRSRLNSIFSPYSNANEHKPLLLRDMLCVIGSDAARRLGDMEFASDILTKCIDHSLRMAAMNWLIRNSTGGVK